MSEPSDPAHPSQDRQVGTQHKKLMKFQIDRIFLDSLLANTDKQSEN